MNTVYPEIVVGADARQVGGVSSGSIGQVRRRQQYKEIV